MTGNRSVQRACLSTAGSERALPGCHDPSQSRWRMKVLGVENMEVKWFIVMWEDQVGGKKG